jgi:MEDS: MEthanogen/methylotroph, DcmR Sensory domain
VTETPESWDRLLRSPFPCDHIIQLYTDDTVLVRALARFIGAGLEQGEAAVAVATAEHIAALTARLAAIGCDVATPAGHGAFVALDAERTLARFMVDGMPDRAAFRSVIVPVLDRLRDSGYHKIRLFGEMVNDLWEQSNTTATVRLEELWNELLDEYRVCLLCAYHIDPIDADHLRRGLLHQITRCHSHAFGDDTDLSAA